MSSRNRKKSLNKTANSPTLDSTKKPQNRNLEAAEDQCQALGKNAQQSLALEDGIEKPCYIKGYN